MLKGNKNWIWPGICVLVCLVALALVFFRQPAELPDYSSQFQDISDSLDDIGDGLTLVDERLTSLETPPVEPEEEQEGEQEESDSEPDVVVGKTVEVSIPTEGTEPPVTKRDPVIKTITTESGDVVDYIDDPTKVVEPDPHQPGKYKVTVDNRHVAGCYNDPTDCNNKCGMGTDSCCC